MSIFLSFRNIFPSVPSQPQILPRLRVYVLISGNLLKKRVGLMCYLEQWTSD